MRRRDWASPASFAEQEVRTHRARKKGLIAAKSKTSTADFFGLISSDAVPQ